MDSAKDGILLDSHDRPILSPDTTAAPSTDRPQTWDQFRGRFEERVRSRVFVQQVKMPGWGIFPLTLFIALLIPVIFVLFILGVGVVVVLKTFLSPLIRFVRG